MAYRFCRLNLPDVDDFPSLPMLMMGRAGFVVRCFCGLFSLDSARNQSYTGTNAMSVENVLSVVA